MEITELFIILAMQDHFFTLTETIRWNLFSFILVDMAGTHVYHVVLTHSNCFLRTCALVSEDSESHVAKPQGVDFVGIYQGRQAEM